MGWGGRARGKCCSNTVLGKTVHDLRKTPAGGRERQSHPCGGEVADRSRRAECASGRGVFPRVLRFPPHLSVPEAPGSGRGGTGESWKLRPPRAVAAVLAAGWWPAGGGSQPHRTAETLDGFLTARGCSRCLLNILLAGCHFLASPFVF